jgi:citrate lyase beta subunit
MLKTVLYWPGTRIVDPARWGAIAPDLLVIDLEESVPMKDRVAARNVLVEQCSKLAAAKAEVAVRLCEASGPGAEQDLLGISRLPSHVGIILPKPVTAAAIARLPSTRPLWLMAEQPSIAAQLPQLCSAGSIRGFIVGLKDICEGHGIAVDPANPIYRRECTQIIEAAHSLSKPVFSGVLLGNEEQIVAGYEDARMLGFDGVSMISIKHIEHLHRIEQEFVH